MGDTFYSQKSSASVIEDNYEGFADKKPLLLNDEFLDDLKVMEVPDSEDECYFWKLFFSKFCLWLDKAFHFFDLWRIEFEDLWIGFRAAKKKAEDVCYRNFISFQFWYFGRTFLKEC